MAQTPISNVSRGLCKIATKALSAFVMRCESFRALMLTAVGSYLKVST